MKPPNLTFLRGSLSLNTPNKLVPSRALSFSRTWRFGDFGSHSGRKITQKVSQPGLFNTSRDPHKSFIMNLMRFFSSDERAFRIMLDELCNLIKQGKLTAPACTEVSLQDYGKALDAAMQPFTSAKQVLIMWMHSSTNHYAVMTQVYKL